jgi:hypothetical protein
MNDQESPSQLNSDSAQQSTIPVEQISPTVLVSKKGFNKWLLIVPFIILLVAAGAFLLGRKQSPSITPTQTSNTTTPEVTPAKTVAGLNLDVNKNYGNKYKDGILPVGDSKYVSDAAKKGYIYACSTYAQNLKTDNGGAGSRGPWFTNNNQSYDINKKSKVQGNVNWQSNFNVNVANGKRTITSNDLPSHVTGVYPIAKTDPAYLYDRNPNSIKSQSLSYALSADPTYGSPNCMGGQVGIMLTGSAIFNAFDAGGRDAGAWEVQDGCGGHPEKQGLYHYHTLSSCITDIGVSKVIGFALDGIPITGPKISDNNILTTTDLDECHGIVSEITVDNKKVTMYHYVMTQDFPYSVSCFRASALQTQPPAGGLPPR